jgi:hypothetical protein
VHDSKRVSEPQWRGRSSCGLKKEASGSWGRGSLVGEEELLGAEVEMRFGEMHRFVSAGKGNGE